MDIKYKNFDTNEELTFSSKDEYNQWTNSNPICIVEEFHFLSTDEEYYSIEQERPQPSIIDRIPYPSKDPKKLKKQIDFLQCWDKLRKLKSEVAEYLSNGQYGDAQDRQRDIENLYRRHPALRYKIS